MKGGGADRRRARRRGRWGELAAVWLLRLKGYSILARGFAPARGTGAGEVDIIARRGRRLVFVEVKTRAGQAEAAEAILPAQRRRIQRAAQLFLAARPELAQCELRFDAVLVCPGRWPVHVADAWRMDA